MTATVGHFRELFFRETESMKTIKIKGMSCQHCVKAVKKALEEIDGIADVNVDLAKGEASFTEEHPLDGNIIKEKIQKAGYEVG